METLMSLLPKSVTAPLAMGIGERIGGNTALTAVYCIITGILGAVVAPYLFAAAGVRNPLVSGYALGTVAHGIGMRTRSKRALRWAPSPGSRLVCTA